MTRTNFAEVTMNNLFLKNEEFVRGVIARPGELRIRGLNSLDVSLVEQFLSKISSRKGKTFMVSGGKMNEGFAKALVKFQGDLEINIQPQMEEKLDISAMRILFQRQNLDINIFLFYGHRGVLLELVANHIGTLKIDISVIDEAMAHELVKHRGKLILQHATLGSVKVYDILAPSGGGVELREEDQRAFVAGMRSYFEGRAAQLKAMRKRGP